MAKRELKKPNEKTDQRPPDDSGDLSPMPPHDPIEPDPMNPEQSPQAGPKYDRPDRVWAEHEE
jgi:hypothetical protein